MSINAEIIAVGTELLLGEISNTDAQIVSQALSELGINVYYHTVVGDNENRLLSILEIAKNRSDIIITTGGLGPTFDDLTKKIVASSFGKNLVLHEEQLSKIRSHFNRMGWCMCANNESQAWLPEGCTVLENDWGTAPGCAIEADGKHAIMLPGPPRECEPMVRERMIPYLRKLSDAVIVSHRLHIFGMGESTVEEKIRDLAENMENPTLAPYAKQGEVMLRVTGKAETRDVAEALTLPVVERVKEILGSAVYGVDTPSLACATMELLFNSGKTLATAESCTGGLLSKLITDVPGASKSFIGGVCAYSNAAKEKLLNIPYALIEQHGAVSEKIASEMARAAAETFNSDIGIGITGFAGPDSAGGKTGTVYISLYCGGEYKNEKIFNPRSRDAVRAYAAQTALNMLRLKLLGNA